MVEDLRFGILGIVAEAVSSFVVDAEVESFDYQDLEEALHWISGDDVEA